MYWKVPATEVLISAGRQVPFRLLVEFSGSAVAVDVAQNGPIASKVGVTSGFTTIRIESGTAH